MTATKTGSASRQSAVLSMVAVLHAGAFVLAAGGLLPRLIEALPRSPVLVVVTRPPETVVLTRPEVPAPGDYAPVQAPLPEVEIPRLQNDPAGPAPETGPGIGGEAHAAPAHRDILPTLRNDDDRLAALIDACYPATARRRGEEGRALARIVIDPRGRVADWSVLQGTGLPRLDSAVDCVIRRLSFNPARRDGSAVTAVVQIPITFRLD